MWISIIIWCSSQLGNAWSMNCRLPSHILACVSNHWFASKWENLFGISWRVLNNHVLQPNLTRIVRLVFDEKGSRSAQSVRPFVQSSSCRIILRLWGWGNNVPGATQVVSQDLQHYEEKNCKKVKRSDKAETKDRIDIVYSEWGIPIVVTCSSHQTWARR